MVSTQDICLAVQPYLEKLSALETRDQIKDFLIAEGVTGRPIQPESCVIAAYLEERSGHKVSVAFSSVLTVPDDCDLGERIGAPSMAMVDFIIRFDQGDYPELVA